MKKSKIFKTGRSQAVRLPKAFRFDEGTEVSSKHIGNGVLLLPLDDNPWLAMQEAVAEFEPGFQIERDDQGEQKREGF